MKKLLLLSLIFLGLAGSSLAVEHRDITNTAANHGLHLPGYAVGTLATLTPVANATPGDLAYNRQDGTYYVYTGSAWVPVTGPSYLTKTPTPTNTRTSTSTLTPTHTPTLTSTPTLTLSPTPTVTSTPTMNLNPQYGAFVFNDFIGACTEESQPFAIVTDGTGATAFVSTDNLSNQPGIQYLDTGTDTTGLSYCGTIDRNGPTTQTNAGDFCLGGGPIYFGAMAYVPQLSDVTDRYKVSVGFSSKVTEAQAQDDGLFFRYTDNVNSGRWQACKAVNGTITAADTGVTVQNSTYDHLEILVNSAGTTAIFSINGTVTNTVTALGTGGSQNSTAPYYRITKTAGTNNRYFALDIIEARQEFTTPRW